MNKRSENMKVINDLRSKVTFAMIDLLDELEGDTGGDYGGFDEWGIKEVYKLKGQLNSYRAQKIARYLGKTISKQKLLKYGKPKGYVYTLNNKDISSWLEGNKDALIKYFTFSIEILTDGKRFK